MTKWKPRPEAPVLFLIALILAALGLSSCHEEASTTPKPRGHFRIDLPEHGYRTFAAEYCPCTFSYPEYAVVERKTKYFDDLPDHPCWLNVQLPYFNATIHLSYVNIDSPEKLERVINDGYKYAFRHTVRADFIEETPVRSESSYGMLFDIGGDVASSVQFFVTDSSEHYLRGSLYFNQRPDVDSLRPVIEFLREDIRVLVNSVEWQQAPAAAVDN